MLKQLIIKSSLCVVALFAITANAQANSLNQNLLLENLAMIDQYAEADAVNVPIDSSPGYLAKIVNKASGEVIEIDCLEGTRTACSSFGFFRVLGAKESKPFAVRKDFNYHYNHKEFQYSRANKWYWNDMDKGLVLAWFTAGTLPALMFVIDTALLPYDILASGTSKGKYKKAVQNIARSLNTGNALEVNDAQFDRIIDLVANH